MPSDDGETNFGTDTVSSEQLERVAKDILAHMDAMEDKLMKELQKGMAFLSETAVEDMLNRVLDTRERAAAAAAAVQATGGSTDPNAIPVSSGNGIEATDDGDTAAAMTGVHQTEADPCITANLQYMHDSEGLARRTYSVPLRKATKLRSLLDYLSNAAADAVLAASRSGYSVSGLGSIVVAGVGPMACDAELTKQKYAEGLQVWEQQGGHQGEFGVDVQVNMKRNE